MSIFPKQLSLRSGYPDFQELPWDKPIEAWEGCCPQLVKVPHGFSRHPVAFINIDGVLYAMKEMQPGAAQSEYEILRQIEDANLPAVLPVGSVHTETTRGDASVLITKYLERSLPYSLLFTRQRSIRNISRPHYAYTICRLWRIMCTMTCLTCRHRVCCRG